MSKYYLVEQLTKKNGWIIVYTSKSENNARYEAANISSKDRYNRPVRIRMAQTTCK